MTIQEQIFAALEQILDAVSGDVPGICSDAAGQTASDWRDTQITKGMLAGGAAAGLPVLGYITLPADLVYTLRLMHRCATGICYIKLGHADEETFAGVLAVWSGAISLGDDLGKQVGAKALATAGANVGGGLGLKLSIKAFTLCTSAIAAKKLGPIVAQKVAAKLAAKLAAKATTRWIPVVSAVVGASANAIIVGGIADAAEQYADFVRNSAPC
jgi:hypothetical protein